MSVLEKLRNLIEEPPPAFAFEIGPEGIAYWHSGTPRFEPSAVGQLPPDSGILAEILGRITPSPGSNRKRAAALILPDSAARVSLMDFDQFPRKADEQQNLLRFRLKRTVPFDIDTAILRYQVKPRGGNKVEVIAAAIAVETLAPYESAFRVAGFHAGFITIAGLSAANLASHDSMSLKLSGSTLSLSSFHGDDLSLFRCLELQSGSLDEILDVVDPTLAYLEDERKMKPVRIEVCGFQQLEPMLATHMRETWAIDVHPMRSRYAAVDANNAGLHGYLTAMGVN